VKTLQRLSNANSLIKFTVDSSSESLAETESDSDWEVEGGNFRFTGENYYVSSHYVLEATPTNNSLTTPMVVSLDVGSVFDVDDVNESFVFSCVVYCGLRNVTINAKLHDALGQEVESNIKVIQAGSWTALRSNVFTKVPLTPPSVGQYTVSLTIVGHGGETVKISTPNLVNEDSWASNPVIQSMRPYIPGFYESYDRNETDPQYPFFRYVDVLTDAIADTMFLYSEWFQFDSREIIPGASKADLSTRSRLTNYQAVYDENLSWLAQFSGAKIKNQLYVGNAAIVTNTNEFKKSQLFPAIYGRGAGTQGSIREAVGHVLSGTKTVVIGQHVDGNPWIMKVVTIISETSGFDIRNDVRVATTENIDLFGTTGGLKGGDTVDGVTLAAGDRVLVKDQIIEQENGVYIATSPDSMIVPSRAADFDTSGEMQNGATFYVLEGDDNKRKAFELAVTGTVTIDTTALTFITFRGSPEVLAAAEPARPLGYSLIHEIVREFTLTLGDLEFGILGTATL
jgi:hypothetical protein